jgi:hypothetical protein
MEKEEWSDAVDAEPNSNEQRRKRSWPNLASHLADMSNKWHGEEEQRMVDVDAKRIEVSCLNGRARCQRVARRCAVVEQLLNFSKW